MGAAETEAAPLVGGDSAAQGFVPHRWPAEDGRVARERVAKVLGGGMESGTVCGPEKNIFDPEIRVEESQTAGHSRPARGCAEHA